MNRNDLEFSDYGRSPRFIDGWWVLPAIVIAVLILVLATRAASAQTAAMEPRMQALSNKLIQEINNGLQCVESTITLQQQLVQAQAEIARLKTPPVQENKEEKK